MDCNMLPITNSETEIYAACLPTSSAKAIIPTLLEGKEKERVTGILADNGCAVCVVPYEVDCDGVTYIKLPKRVGENTLAHHIIGCVNSEMSGTSGLEYAYNDILSSGSLLYAYFTVDGKGDYLLGVPPYFGPCESISSNSVVTTIDINIQKAVEGSLGGMIKGAVIVCESQTGKIRAICSKPDFSFEDLEKSLNDTNSPLVNRAVSCFSVGSVFKPCIAAAAIENGMGNTLFTCEGKTQIENRTFNCHKHEGHGLADMRLALKESCNCYFYNLSCNLGAETIYTYAKRFSLGSKIKLGDNIYAESGIIPSVSKLETLSSRANFGIGQGEILLSPVALLNLYNAIATDGSYVMPSLIEKTVCMGKTEEYKPFPPTKAIKSSTAKELRSYLQDVVEDGTGIAAKSEKITAAGKTATAQTGRFNINGTEITNSWFCGYSSINNTMYTVVVMSEGDFQKSPSAIFREICENINDLY